ncbi:cyclin-like protein interacting with PHO85 [Marasmius crinis-equi]|uniref:Cyclin-like protein interacting with PHO85 n=1 Tax=Marasmius crinis-equi TaxID=585013 RepID=A0ABR3FKI0_9AGAR
MLALAHPYDPSSELPHRASSSSSIPRQRPSHRKPSSSSTSSSSASASTSRHPSSSSMPTAVTSSSSRHTHSSQQHHTQQQPSIPRPAPPQKAAVSPATTSSPKVESIPVVPAVSETLDIHSYPSTDLLRLLASLLSQIAAANDKLDSSSAADSHPNLTHHASAPSIDSEHAPFWRSLTTASRTAIATPSSTLTFHARNIPTITLEAYLLRILKYCPTTNEVFLSLLVYFDRMSKLSADATGRTFVIDSFNIHRLVIAGVTVASKFFSDVFYTNSRYAKVGGLPLAELNQLELQFLLLNDFNLVIPTDEMQRYAEQLILFSSSPTGSPNGIKSAAAMPTIGIRATAAPAQTISSSPTSSVSSFASSSGSSTVVPGSSGASADTTPQSERMRAMGAIDAYGGKIPGAPVTSMPGAYASNGGVQAQMKTPRRGSVSDAGSVCSVSSQSDADGDTETETETEAETDGGWTTDDEPTIRPGGHGKDGSSCGDSTCSFDEEGRSDIGDNESLSSRDGDDERDDSMDIEDEMPVAAGRMLVDVERTPDSERVWRAGRAGVNVNI